MTATALSVASVHLTGINASRKKCGLRALTLVEVESEFADVNRPLGKAIAPRTTSNTVAADTMWGGIVSRLNMMVPVNRTPVGAGRTSPASSAKPTQASADSMWAGIATGLNKQAGLKTPARSAR